MLKLVEKNNILMEEIYVDGMVNYGCEIIEIKENGYV